MAAELAYINPDLLRWARERSQLKPGEVADRAAMKAEKIKSWESGERQPTLRQAQNLARVLRIPFGYLFLSSPPPEPVSLPDLRTIADKQRGVFSIDFREVLNDVTIKQQWYKEYLEQDDSPAFAVYRQV